MKTAKSALLIVCLLVAVSAFSQNKLSAKWEELTAGDFVTAVQQSRGTCILPFGIIEKHGPHLPLGTDLINVRRAVMDSTQKEYALVFPEFYFGQIFEAQQEPGTNEEIKTFCSRKYNVSFPMMSKVSVLGEDKTPLYKFLTDKTTNPKVGGDIKWNFTKFLFDRNGNPVARFEPAVTPDSAEVQAAVESALGK